MTQSAALPFVSVDALHVGMFVQLELGWMAHPFPRSSFRIASEEQIRTLRGLGLTQVRYCPDRSDAPAADAAVAAPVVESPAADAAPAGTDARALLAAERAALQRCERHYAEAAQALRAATDAVPGDPQRAGRQARALSRALVERMGVDRELNIRILVHGSGDRSAAHGLNVAILALLMGRNFGLGADEMADLGVGALMHDVGKLELPERLRAHDPGFTAHEVERWREHVALGVAQARRMGFGEGVQRVIAQHHEQADGRGFPGGLNIDRMSAAARIVALVNRFDHLCNPPQAGLAMTPHEALSLMFAQGQQQFDTTMLSAFIRMVGIYPPGSAVQLTDDRYALVVTVNSTRPLKPQLRVHDAAAPDDEPPLLDLQTVSGLGIRRSLKPAQLPPAALRQLAPQPRMCFGFEPAAPPPAP